MIDFENTEIGFKSKSNSDLRRAEFLFKTLSNPSIVKLGKIFTNAALSIGFPVGWAVKPTVYKHFVGGETIEKCQPVVEVLGQHNVKAILDYSVEGTDDPETIESALEETQRSIDNASRENNIPFAVFKPTAFGDSLMLQKASVDSPLSESDKKEKALFFDRIDRLCKTAFEKKVPVLIDAEDYAFQKHIDHVVEEMMKKYNREETIVFNTLQMYRKDRLDFLKESIAKARTDSYYYGVKFVRGAYMEKERERAERMGYEDPVQPDKESTDRDYNAALKYSVENLDIVTVFNGTHNEYSSEYLTKLMKEHNINKDDKRVWFSQLYGMSDHISFNLAEEGYNVAKYVPYGPVKHVLPYLIRRAEENTSVKGQTGRELKLILQEKKRRRNK
ncbi:MAG: proline dehydrogenase family protein [Bacteroidales bacterium]|nr:proline dehydrogenase family protein [Bacteroidales bacterium]